MEIIINNKEKGIEIHAHINNIPKMIEYLEFMINNENRNKFLSGEIFLSIDGYTWEKIKEKMDSIFSNKGNLKITNISS